MALLPDEVSQDNMRPLRAFVGLINGYMGNDQSYAGQDGIAANPPRQFLSVSPQGAVSIEGTQNQVQAAPGKGLVLSPTVLMIGAAIALGVLLPRLLKKG